MQVPIVTSSIRTPSSQQPETLGTRMLALLVFIGLAVLYIGTSNQPVIWDETEGQYAGAAREMLERGDWLVPTNGGIPRLQKPPLVTWALMASYEVFGVTVFAARLPNALASIGWLFAVYLLGRERGGVTTGARAAYLLGTAIGAFIFCHIIMPEPFLAMFITLTIWCFFRALRAGRRTWIRGWMMLAWVFMALGCLSKGLLGALYPLSSALLASLFVFHTRYIWLH